MRGGYAGSTESTTTKSISSVSSLGWVNVLTVDQHGWRTEEFQLCRVVDLGDCNLIDADFEPKAGQRFAHAMPSEHATLGVNGRRVYPVEALRPLVAEFEQHGKPYIDPNDPSIARVPIMSWSKTRGEALIDAADLPLIEGMRFNLMDAREEDDRGAVVVRSGPSGEQTPLRRILLGLWGNEHRYSHRNGDALDCRRANIVVKTHGEQVHGGRKCRTTQGGKPPTSRFKGVCWIEKQGKWRAQIQKEGVCKRLGVFDDENAAAEAYDEAARELFGEHARTNFPDGVDAWLSNEAQASQEDDAPGDSPSEIMRSAPARAA